MECQYLLPLYSRPQQEEIKAKELLTRIAISGTISGTHGFILGKDI
jgi:hypothetical protein